MLAETPAVDAVLDGLDEERECLGSVFEHGPAVWPDRDGLGVVRRGRPLPGEQHAVPGGVLEPEGHVRLAARDQAACRILAGGLLALLDRLGQLVEDPDDDGHEDRVPVREVGVDRRGGDTGLPGDRAQRDRLRRAGPLDQGKRSRPDVLGQPGSFLPYSDPTSFSARD